MDSCLIHIDVIIAEKIKITIITDPNVDDDRVRGLLLAVSFCVVSLMVCKVSKLTFKAN